MDRTLPTVAAGTAPRPLVRAEAATPDQVTLSSETPRPSRSVDLRPAAAAVPGPVGVWLSTIDGKSLLERRSDVEWSDGTRARRHIVLDASQKFQEMEGFGASMTDSSAFLLRERLSPEARAEVMDKVFGEDGIRLSLLRQPMGSCDYSLDLHTYQDRPGEPFSIEPDRCWILPALKEAFERNPDLKVIATPWSAPAWMKTSGSLMQGSLKPEHHEAYGEYFARFVEEYAKEGVPIAAVTVQNEPLYTPPHYPGMGMSARQQAEFVKEGLAPAFERHGLDTGIIAYDHNWDRPDYPLTVLDDPKAAEHVDGVAWHSYGGRHEAMSAVHEKHPDKGMWFTEASGGEWVPPFHDAFMDQMGHVIRAPRNHANSVVWWNLALDRENGPSLLGDKSTCRGLVTVDQATGEVDYNVDYYTMGHASKFVDPGARRIASNSFKDDLEDVAFENPDGSRVLIVSNRTDREKTFTVEDEGRTFEYTLPGKAAATFKWS